MNGREGGGASVFHAKARPYLWILMLAGGLLLSACGGGGSSSPAQPPAPVNRAPVADAGDDVEQAIQPSPVALDGTGSSDPDDDELSFQWSVRSQPESADTALENASSAQPSFVPPVPGEYVFELEVSDPAGLSSTDAVTVTLTNEPPAISLAEFDRNVVVGDGVTLDASASSDADGHALTYSWHVVDLPAESGIPVGYSGSGSTLTVQFDKQGEYVFELHVTDGYATTVVTLDTFIVTVYSVIPLSEQMVDAEFDAVGERIVAIAENQLVVIGSDGDEANLALRSGATAVSVSPDGATAVIGHGKWVSHVDLNALRVLNTYEVPRRLGDVVLDGQGQAHGFSHEGSVKRIYSVDLASGTVRVGTGSIGGGIQARLHPSGTKIYGADNGASPSDLERYSIVDGATRVDYDSPYHGDFQFCGNVWFDPEGRILLSPCGVVVRATDDQASDLRFAMRLKGLRGRIRHAASSAFDNLWYVIEKLDGQAATRVRTFAIENGEPVEGFDLPPVDGGGGRRWSANFVFASANSPVHYVIAADNSADSVGQALLVRQTPELARSNLAPTASVPRFLTARVSEEITLDGSESYDPEGVPLNFIWSLFAAPDGFQRPTELSGSSIRFVATMAGVYEFELRVHDGERESPIARSTVTVFEPDESLIHRLEPVVADAEYSDSLHALVYLSAGSNDLNILDIAKLTQRTVELDRQPHRVGLSPDGLMAAVSHSGLISLVDLRTAAKTDVEAVPDDWGDLVLDHRGRAHMVPASGGWSRLYSVDFSEDRVVSLPGRYDPSIAGGSQMRMHPTEDWVYTVGGEYAPSVIEKFDVGAYPPVRLGDSRDLIDVPIDSNAWISETGDHMLTAAGSVLYSSRDPETDLTYSGQLPDEVRVQWADHATEIGEWAVLTADVGERGAPVNELAFYTDDFFNRVSVSPLVGIPLHGGVADTAGSHVFQSEDGSTVIALMRADELLHSHAVLIVERQ